MLSHTPTTRHHAIRRSPLSGGFTMVELIAVMAIVAVVAVATLPRLQAMDDSRSAMAAQTIAEDLRYARSRAQATGVRHWTVFDPSAESWSVLAETLGAPGRGSASTLQDPATDAPLWQQLGYEPFPNTAIQKVSFDRGDEVGFDVDGSPINHREKPLGKDGYVQLSTGTRIEVEAISGRISVR